MVPGVFEAPPVPVKELFGFLGGSYFGFLGVLGGSGLGGAILLAAVLSELPAFGFDEDFGAILAGLLILPAVLAQRTFNEDLLTFADHLGEVFSAGSPDLHVNKRGDLAFLVIDGVGLIDAKGEIANRGAFWRETNFGIVDQVADNFDVVEDHNLICYVLSLVCFI